MPAGARFGSTEHLAGCCAAVLALQAAITNAITAKMETTVKIFIIKYTDSLKIYHNLFHIGFDFKFEKNRLLFLNLLFTYPENVLSL